MLTYKGHLKKDLLIKELCKRHKQAPKFIRVAHESADKADPYEHSHVLIWLSHQPNVKKCNFWDMKTNNGVIHPNLKPINSNTHWDNAKPYLAKEDRENMDLVDRSEMWYQQATKAETLKDAVSQGKATEYFARERVFKDEKLKKMLAAVPVPEINLDWQKDLYSCLTNEESYTTRQITWIYDTIGNTGKTNFVRHFSLKHAEETIVLTNFGGQANVANLILNSMIKGIEPKYILIDLPRTFVDRNIYEPLEVLKNGMLSNTKYVCEFVQFKCPYIVVFANFPPHVVNEDGSDTMSRDRWDIGRLKKGWRDNTRITSITKISYDMCKKKNEKVYLKNKDI